LVLCRYLYPVDKTRKNEFGLSYAEEAGNSTAATAKSEKQDKEEEQETEKKKTE
jgi:hypothetical protein